MYKRLSYLFLALILLLALCACGSSEETASDSPLDVHQVAADIVATGAFTDVTTENTNGQALSVYGLAEDTVLDYSVYFSSMATPEEVAVFEVSSPEQASTVMDACKARQSTQVQNYETYAPDQVEKLNNAIIANVGDVVYYIVTNDPDAVKSVLKEYDMA